MISLSSSSSRPPLFRGNGSLSLQNTVKQHHPVLDLLFSKGNSPFQVELDTTRLEAFQPEEKQLQVPLLLNGWQVDYESTPDKTGQANYTLYFRDATNASSEFMIITPRFVQVKTEKGTLLIGTSEEQFYNYPTKQDFQILIDPHQVQQVCQTAQRLAAFVQRALPNTSRSQLDKI